MLSGVLQAILRCCTKQTYMHAIAGDILYLPAGWFHEVTSRNTAPIDGLGWHMALNYWFHPPDNLVESLEGFQLPYKSSYWADLHNTRGSKSS